MKSADSVAKPQRAVPVGVEDLGLLMVAAIWGSSYVTTKHVLFVLPIFLFVVLRFSLSAVLMAGVFWQNIRRIDRETLKIGIILGIFLSVIFVLEISGIHYTSAANAGFIISLAIILTPLVEAIAMRRMPAPILIGCAVVSLIGCALLTIRAGFVPRLGDVLILGAALARAIQVTYSGSLTKGRQYDESVLTTVQITTVAATAVILALVRGEFAISLSTLSTSTWLIILYLAVFGTCFAFYVQLRAIRRTSPTRVGILLGTEPVFAAIFAVAFGSSELGIKEWLGGGLIVASAYVARTVKSEAT